MSPALLFVCCAALATGALASRATVEEAQEVPWRKAAALGTILGHTFVGDAVGLLDRADDSIADVKGDAYDRLQSSLAKSFLDSSETDLASLGKLMASLRKHTSAEDDLVRTLEAGMSGARRKGFVYSPAPRDELGVGFDQLSILGEDGSPGVVIVRHLPGKRSTELLETMGHLLFAVERSMAYNGSFLRYFAQSHTFEELASDMDAEVLLMRESYFCSLRELLTMEGLRFEARLNIYLHAVLAVQNLNKLKIPHISAINPDTVFLRTENVNAKLLDMALSPLIIIPGSPVSVHDMWKADTRQLGVLLRFLLGGEWEEAQQPAINVLLAFGKALEAGAFSGQEASPEFFQILSRIASPYHDPDELVALRMHYLRRAVDSEDGMELGQPAAA